MSYDAFISYSHAKDKPVAAALQSVVQTLGKPWYQRRALRVFRDDTSLSATPHLWPTIEQSISQSRYLILLASPEAASSQWVNKEITYWLEHRSVDTLLIAVTDGELTWDSAAGDFKWSESTPLPPALKGRFPVEPKWADLRSHRERPSARDIRFIELGADFAAAIRGMPKEDLLSQEVRQQRRALTLAWSAAGSLLILAGLAGWQWRDAVTQRDQARQNFAIGEQVLESLGARLAGLVTLQARQQASQQNIRELLELAHVELARLYAGTGNSQIPVGRTPVSMATHFSHALSVLGDGAGAIRFAEQAVVYARGPLEYIPRPGCLACDVDVRRSNVNALGDLSIALNRLAESQIAQRLFPEALATYREGATIARTAPRTHYGNVVTGRAFIMSLMGLGDLLRANWAQRDIAGALEAYQHAIDFAHQVLSRTNDVDVRFQLATAFLRTGDLARDQRDIVRATDRYRQALDSARPLQSDSNISPHIDVVIILSRLANVGDDPRARLTEALQILQRLRSENRLPRSEEATVTEIQRALAKLPRR
jgi:tetratricopeptide (TPR) repeat protein